ncbi:LysR family transcriptional regulator [Nocardioides sp. YIM B13467]|uniref:LysR family transcriptional regulator n=1 Tax=Nocardioides sp. YIM B13467 TaxID=3366294 RepID=UPI00366AF90E
MSVRFSLRQLEYFVAIAEEGTLSDAAARLHVSQPGISQSFTDLERALDVQLAVRRKAHGVTLTPTGTQVLRHARELLRHAEDLASVASGGDALSGVLTLGCYVTLAPTALPPLLQDFTALHPGLTIDFVEGTQDVLQRKLLHGELDLAIVYDMEIQPEMERAVIDSRRPHILLPASHRLAHEQAVSLADLADEPMVLLDAPPSSHNTLAIFDEFDIRPDVRYRPTTFELTRALVGRGMGYALLVQRPANDRTYEGREVVVKEIADPVGESHVLVIWPQAARLNRRAAAFVEFSQQRRQG